MTKKMVTTAVVQNLLKGLEEEKNYWLHVERSSSTYTVGLGEEPVIPDYYYSDVSEKIDEIDRRILTLTHSLNIHNMTAEITVGSETMSVDMILMRLDQLNKRKSILGKMRRHHPVSRIKNKEINATPEYVHINYDMKCVCTDFDKATEEMMELQTALDIFNQTKQFEIDA